MSERFISFPCVSFLPFIFFGWLSSAPCSMKEHHLPFSVTSHDDTRFSWNSAPFAFSPQVARTCSQRFFILFYHRTPISRRFDKTEGTRLPRRPHSRTSRKSTPRKFVETQKNSEGDPLSELTGGETLLNVAREAGVGLTQTMIPVKAREQSRTGVYIDSFASPVHL